MAENYVTNQYSFESRNHFDLMYRLYVPHQSNTKSTKDIRKRDS